MNLSVIYNNIIISIYIISKIGNHIERESYLKANCKFIQKYG